MRLDELLTNRQVPFERLHHAMVYGANRIAQTLHVPGKEVAKPVLAVCGSHGSTVDGCPGSPGIHRRGLRASFHLGHRARPSSQPSPLRNAGRAPRNRLRPLPSYSMIFTGSMRFLRLGERTIVP